MHAEQARLMSLQEGGGTHRHTQGLPSDREQKEDGLLLVSNPRGNQKLERPGTPFQTYGGFQPC